MKKDIVDDIVIPLAIAICAISGALIVASFAIALFRWAIR